MAAHARRLRLPARVYAYVAAVTTVSLLALPLSLTADGHAHGVDAAVGAATLLALIVAAYRRPVRIGPKRHANVTTAPEVAAVLLLPGPLAVLVLAAGTLAGEANRRAPLVQRVFNTAVALLRGVAGVAVYALVLRLRPDTLAEPVASVLAALAM